MAQTQTILGKKFHSLTRREQLILIEISKDSIDSASSFVDYISDYYSISKSSIWHVLKSLKSSGLLEFASRYEIGKPLRLTRYGTKELGSISDKDQITHNFEEAALTVTGSVPAVYNTPITDSFSMMLHHRRSVPRVEGGGELAGV